MKGSSKIWHGSANAFCSRSLMSYDVDGHELLKGAEKSTVRTNAAVPLSRVLKVHSYQDG